MLKTHKQYCVHGHDTHTVGRSKNGTCRECQRNFERRARKLRQECAQDFATEPPVQLALVLSSEKQRKRFCARGHDTYIVGRKRRGQCKQCARDAAATLVQRAVNGDVAPERLCEHGLEFRSKSGRCRKCAKKHQMKWAYGVTHEWYEERAAQGCSICGKTQEEHFREFNNALSVDHCHTSERPRGVLCMRCNSGLGYFRDRVSLLLRAALYLSDEKTPADLTTASP